MNKQQIIAPLVAMGLCVIIIAVVFRPSHPRYPNENLLAEASLVADDIISKTNSDRLTSIEGELKSTLLQFLAAQVQSRTVRARVPDEGKPTVEVSLVNDANRNLVIDLRWEARLRKFKPICFADYPAIRALTDKPPEH